MKHENERVKNKAYLYVDIVSASETEQDLDRRETLGHRKNRIEADTTIDI